MDKFLSVIKMSDSPFTDAITFNQPVMKEISSDEAKNAFLDPNLAQILRILRDNRHPMTVDEIEETFKSIDQQKSTQTIYRYLKRLENLDLIVPAGKRVFSSSTKKITTKTLYMRSARLFFPIRTIDELKIQKKEMATIIGELISDATNEKVISSEKLTEFIADLFIRESELVRGLLQQTDEDQVKKIDQWDIKQRQSAIAILGRLVLYNDDIDWKKRYLECFEE